MIEIVREALVVVVKRWTPLLFSWSNQQLLWTPFGKKQNYCFLLLSLRWKIFWKAPALAEKQSTYLFFTSIVEYCYYGTVTVAADVTINHVEADDLGHIMMLNDTKNTRNPAVFIGIFFFREHLFVFRCAFMIKPFALKRLLRKVASCAPSCGSSVRRWVASRTKQASALYVALFHQVQIRSIGVRFGKNGHDFRLYGYR